MPKTDTNTITVVLTQGATIPSKVPPRRAPRTAGRSPAPEVATTSAIGNPVAAVVPDAAGNVVEAAMAPDLATVVGDGLARFKGIILPTGPQQTAVRQMHSLLAMGERRPEGQMRRAYR